MAPLNLLEKLVTIDLNPDIITLGKKYFGFDPDGEILESIEGDAYEFVQANHNS